MASPTNVVLRAKKMESKSDHDLAQIIWDYMRYEQPLEKADVIIGMGSADNRTAEWTAKLYLDGYAPKIIFSGARGELTRNTYNDNEADIFKEIAIERGVPDSSILVENRATNSGENIQNVATLIEDQHLTANTIIIVSKPYMLRRHYATFIKQWPSQKLPRIICSGINLTMDEYTHNSYISLEYMTHIIIGDLQRIREYPKLGFQIEQEIPEIVWAAYEELVRRGYTKHLLANRS